MLVYAIARQTQRFDYFKLAFLVTAVTLSWGLVAALGYAVMSLRG